MEFSYSMFYSYEKLIQASILLQRVGFICNPVTVLSSKTVTVLISKTVTVLSSKTVALDI